MKKLLLINPWIFDFTAYDLWSKPLGLLYLSSFLRSVGFEISLLDCLDKYAEQPLTIKVKKYGVGHYARQVIEKPAELQHIPRHFARYGVSEGHFIEQLLLNRNADAILITSLMTYWYLGVQRAVELVRQYLPGKPIILGGIYASLMPEHAQLTIKPDYLITGPGELKALRLLAEIFELPINEAKFPETIDDFPYPAFDLIRHPDYLIIMTSRGCPYDCSFCAQKQIAMPFTQRQPEAVVREIRDQFRRYKLPDFAFYDDALFIKKEKHIQIILEKVIKEKLPVRFHTPNGLFAKYLDAELASLLFRSNFKTIRLSFETASEQRREDMHTKVSSADMIAAVQNLVKAGFRAKDIEAYVLMGLPGQSLHEVIASVLFIHNIGLQVRLASFTPIPGTQEFARAVSAGLIAADIDPLLTNKSIYPLNNGEFSYETYRKVRQFTQTLNEAVKSDLRMFVDSSIGAAVRKAVGQIL